MEPDIEPWNRFRDWLQCICVVTFDLKLGQALEESLEKLDESKRKVKERMVWNGKKRNGQLTAGIVPFVWKQEN
uniref:Ovule protein n=1 Tax=Caenorhabditis tropicalis TaxID=1561998 RepID=A0A1I7UZK4_9PELO